MSLGTKYSNGWSLVSKQLFDLSFFDSYPLLLFILIFSIRLINSLSIRTFFQADEYWQVLEPAHNFVFGYGYLTWEWKLGLRSFSYPFLYSIPYQICRFFELDYSYVLNLPKILNALIASIGEFYLYYLVLQVSKDKIVSKLVLILSLFSSWNWYCWTRSFSNSLELTLTITALYYYYDSRIALSFGISAFNCLIRPTNAIIWLYFGFKLFTSKPKIIFSVVFTASIISFIDALINYWFYNNWNFPILQFLEFNVTRNLSSFYGISRLDFYVFQAIPILLLNYLPFFLFGMLTTKWSDFKTVMIIYLFMFSLIQHKEFRFIYPLMPMLLLYTAKGFQKVLLSVSKFISKLIILITILLSVLISVYFTIYHESGVIAVTQSLRNKILQNNSVNQIEVGFLTPCHSTPFQSHFHLDPSIANIWFLTCEPPLHLSSSENLAHYMDESDIFYENPVKFLKTNFPEIIDTKVSPSIGAKYPHKWPEYLVIFQHLQPYIEDYIGDNYMEIERIFNSRFHWDYRRTGDVIIYQYKP